MRREPLEVPRQGTREREESDDDDDRRQRQDRRLLCGPRDQVAGGRDERDAESDRESAERERECDTSTRQLREREETGHERHAASRAGTTSRPPSSRTIRSASAASSGRCATSTTVRPRRRRSIASATTLRALGVEVRRRLVENHERRVAEERTGEREPASLSGRELAPTVPDDRLEAAGKPRDECVRTRKRGRFAHAPVVGRRVAEADVVRDRAPEERRALRHEGRLPAPRLRVE